MTKTVQPWASDEPWETAFLAAGVYFLIGGMCTDEAWDLAVGVARKGLDAAQAAKFDEAVTRMGKPSRSVCREPGETDESLRARIRASGGAK